MAASVRFPIWIKLVSIVTIILLFSLGVITTIVAFLVSADVYKTAKENNFSINEMSAQTTLNTLNSVKANTLVLLKNISFVSRNNNAGNKDAGLDSQMFNYFFSQNKMIVCVVVRSGSTPLEESGLFVNESVANSLNITNQMFLNFIKNNEGKFNRSLVGDVFLCNTAETFNGPSLLTMSFPLENFSSAIVFFNSETITETFGTGANETVVINGSGDILVSADQDMVRNGKNISANKFVQDCLKSDGKINGNRFKDLAGNEFLGDADYLSGFDVYVISTISLDIVFEGIKATTRRIIYLSLLVWFVSILFLWFFAKSISGPLADLKDAVKQIEDGDYRINLSSKSNDETGILTTSVQSMSNILENFARFTNKSLARLARQGKLETGGAAKQATVFFSDIRAFTAISEKLSPNEIVEFLNDYMDRMVSCVIITGGAIDKFIGDAVMAHWGAEESAGSAEIDALNGVRAALMMRASLRSFNKTRGGEKNPVIRIGCGLNSGTVVAGQIGSEERVVYTVIGETVSFADRTETFNKAFGTEILISENTYNLAGRHIIAQEMGTVTEGGKKVKIFAVINMKDKEESDKLLAMLDKMQKTDPAISRECIGEGGPQNIDDVRRLLGIEAPDLSRINLDEEEKKYSLKNDNKSKKTTV